METATRDDLRQASAVPVIVVKYAELALKGQNRGRFETLLAANIRARLAGTRHRIRRGWKRMYVYAQDEKVFDVAAVLERTFGVAAFAHGIEVAKTEDALVLGAVAVARRWLGDRPAASFKIEARREDKTFPLTSYEVACLLGDAVRAQVPGLTVDVRAPDLTINVEVRDRCYVYGPSGPGGRGLPLGSSGRGLLLLSGGIDSPVAGFLMARRGLALEAIHFHTYPFTSHEAEQKVAQLAQRLQAYVPGLRTFSVPFTPVQVRIRERAAADQTTLLLRACMMLAADQFARARGAHCLVTGESLGQVASQTVANLAFTDARTELPVFRPLIGFDKDDIIQRAMEIDTYGISIQPFPDCCSLFSPRHPVLWPQAAQMQKALDALDAGELVSAALRDAVILHPATSLARSAG